MKSIENNKQKHNKKELYHVWRRHELGELRSRFRLPHRQ